MLPKEQRHVDEFGCDGMTREHRLLTGTESPKFWGVLEDELHGLLTVLSAEWTRNSGWIAGLRNLE